MTNSITVHTIKRQELSVKTQAVATFLAVLAAVVLPQVFHVMGLVSGVGTGLGEALLPMHLPVILVGLLAGKYAGGIAGLLAPVISFALTGMPVGVMLPFMVIELGVYGLTAGLLRNVKLPTIAKVLFVQMAGRAVKAAAILVSVCVIGNAGIKVASIWYSISTGIFGIILQALYGMFAKTSSLTGLGSLIQLGWLPDQ